MELFRFITSFFISKQISLMTAFICWPPGSINKLVRESSACGDDYCAGLRVKVVRDFLRAPELGANGLHREGVLLDINCPNVTDLLSKASKSRAFSYHYTWLFLDDSSLNVSSIEEFLGAVNILPDADVTWSSADAAVELYKVKENQSFIVTPLELTRNDSSEEMKMMWNGLPSTVTRRRNLGNVSLKAATVISQPQLFKGWTDLTTRRIDTFPKLIYSLLMLLAQDLNYRYNLKQTDLFGVERNGSFDGGAGLLQRQEIEVGLNTYLMRADRTRIMEFVSEICELRSGFLFRQPPQSSVSNVFLLPFSRGVWAAACGLVLVTAAVMLAALAWRLRARHPELEVLTLPETVSFALGTICQQGSHVTPDVTSVRVVMFSALVSSLFVFTAYSAKILAILQMPSDALQTVDDLTLSPMVLGVQETAYKRTYFAESTEPATQRLFQQKLLPLGERAYLDVDEGVARLRTGLFAFQVEESAGYDVISKTFTEREKCGLKLIRAFRLPVMAVGLRKKSGYRELFASRLRWQREVGLMSQARRLWMAERPRCEADSGGFISIGLTDVLPALQVLGLGVLLSVLLLGAELGLHAWRRRRA